MGCVVNGPGESREADLSVSCSNGKASSSTRARSCASSPNPRSSKPSWTEALRLTDQATVRVGGETPCLSFPVILATRSLYCKVVLVSLSGLGWREVAKTSFHLVSLRLHMRVAVKARKCSGLRS